MADLAALPSEKILAIPLDKPELLFSPDAAECKKEYRQLAKRWHPDSNPDDNHVATMVFTHVSVLHEAAQKKLKDGVWERPGHLALTDRKGHRHEFKTVRSNKFELGSMHIMTTAVAYVVNEEFGDLVGNAERLIKGFDYANSAMKREHERYLPAIQCAVALKPKGYLLVLNKRPDLILLRDAMPCLLGGNGPKHVAWILSSLYNLKCYLNFAGLVHHDISPDTYFISPKDHNGSLLGGWWYAAREGQRLKALPARTLKFGPSTLRTEKRAVHKTDADLIRATGRELLATVKDVPAALTTWLRGIGQNDSVDEYRVWSEKVLPAAFGARRYTEMPITFAEIYS